MNITFYKTKLQFQGSSFDEIKAVVDEDTKRKQLEKQQKEEVKKSKKQAKLDKRRSDFLAKESLLTYKLKGKKVSIDAYSNSF